VWDGEEWQVVRSSSYKDIIEAIESVEEASLTIRDKAGEVVGKAVVSLYGMEPDETVIDSNVNAFFDEADQFIYNESRA
jgi:uncharacterized protein (UPF0335 family)